MTPPTAIDAASHDDEWFEKLPADLASDPGWARRTKGVPYRKLAASLDPLTLLWEVLLRASERAVQAGMPVNRDTIRAHLHRSSPVTDNQIAQALVTPGFLDALSERGLRLEVNAELTPRQRNVVAIYFDAEVTASHAQRLHLAGIRSATWDGWLKNDPAFRQKVAEITDEVLSRGAVIAKQRLVEQADAGNIKAIDRILAMQNEFDWRVVDNPNIEAVLATVFEVLDERQVDPATMKLLSARLSAVLGSPTTPQGMIAPTPTDIQVQEH